MKTSHPIYDVYFRIEAGYNDGRMSYEQHDRFYTEIRALFSRAGFMILENPLGCPSFQLGTTCLYCHPTELSGSVEEPHIVLVERVLRQGTSFQYQTTDRYDRLYDLPSRRSWPTTGSNIPSGFFSKPSAPRIHRNTTFGMRFSRSWCGN